jgi:serine/threonine-protein kinase
MFFFARSGRVTGGRLMDIGLLFEVVGAVGIDFYLAFGRWPVETRIVGLSWVGVWIVFFPLIVPSTPGKTLLASLAAASATPILYMIGVANGGPPLGGAVAMQYMIPNYICAGMALIGARVLYRMGDDIRRARQLGSYQLSELLGEGGMGEVWKAEHRMLARPAAVKLIREDGGGSGSGRTQGSQLQRFEREVQATSQLRSPHTVEVYDFGLTEDRSFYYVMELLDGVSLEDLVKQYGPVPAERTIHILAQVCNSLAEAHARDLVHRDVKPANIFVCRYGLEHDFTKVLDFGLVKHSGEGPTGEVKLTEVGAFAGTPAYVSPESAMGDPVDGRTDIYSLGCVAYWLLTGRTVFEAATPMQMLIHHVNDEPAPPSTCTELPVPPTLDQLVVECLRKDRTRRPHSADDLAERLRSITVERPWTQTRAKVWWEQHRPNRVDPRASLSKEITRPSGARAPIVKL